jgi:hypothetical protein
VFKTVFPKAVYIPDAETPMGREHQWFLHSADDNEANDILIHLLTDAKMPAVAIIEIVANEMMLEGLSSEQEAFYVSMAVRELLSSHVF